MASKPSYLWQRPSWPAVHYDPIRVGESLGKAYRAQGVVEGKLAALGFDQRLVSVA